MIRLTNTDSLNELRKMLKYWTTQQQSSSSKFLNYLNESESESESKSKSKSKSNQKL